MPLPFSIHLVSTAVIQRWSRSFLKHNAVHNLLIPSSLFLSLPLFNTVFSCAFFVIMCVRVGMELIYESTEWYNWRHTSHHQNTFLCFFMTLFHQNFHIKILVKDGVITHEVSNNSSFIFNIYVLFSKLKFYAHFDQDFKSPILSL